MPRTTRRRFVTLIVVVLALLLSACGQAVAPGQRGPWDASVKPGVPDLRAALNAEFQRLGIDPDKVAAAAPHGETNRVFQIIGVHVDPDGPGPLTGTVFLNWIEQAVGDYDQNSEVNAADLTPLGAHFTAPVTYRAAVDGLDYWPEGLSSDDGGAAAEEPPAAGSPAENWRLARIDGDGNGELNIADITPIALHWQERVSGWRIYRSSSSNPIPLLLPNPVDPLLLYTMGRDLAETYSGGQLDPHRPVTFEYSELWVPTEVWERFYVVPYDAVSDEEGARSAAVELHLDGSMHIVPSASIVAEHNPAVVPWAVRWNTAGSFDPDGTITKYEWDAGDDGTYEEDSGTVPYLDSTYATAGPAVMTVRVTDDQGFTDTATTEVMVGSDNQAPTAAISADVTEGWAPLTVTFDPAASSDPDGTITGYNWDLDGDGTTDRADATPTAFQHEYSAPGIYVVELTVVDDEGASDSMLQVIRAHGWVTTGVTTVNAHLNGFSSAMINDHPALAWAFTDTALNTVYVRYLRATDEEGTIWDAGVSELYSEAGTAGNTPCSLAEVSGRPAVAFMDALHGIRFSRSDDENGAGWPATAVVVYASHGGSYIDLGKTGVRPALAWQDDNGFLYYCWASTPTGAAWMARQEVCGGGASFGNYANLLGFPDVETVPAIAHVNTTDSVLLFDYTWTGDGSVWETQTAVTTSGDGYVGAVSMALVDGDLALAYQSSGTAAGDGLYYRRATYDAATGFDWSSAPQLIHERELTGWDCSLAEIGGRPAVAYRARGADDHNRLSYIEALDDTGTNWGAPVTVEPGSEVDNTELVVLLELNGHAAIAHVRRLGVTEYSLRFTNGY